MASQIGLAGLLLEILLAFPEESVPRKLGESGVSPATGETVYTDVVRCKFYDCVTHFTVSTAWSAGFSTGTGSLNTTITPSPAYRSSVPLYLMMISPRVSHGQARAHAQAQGVARRVELTLSGGWTMNPTFGFSCRMGFSLDRQFVWRRRCNRLGQIREQEHI